MQEYTITRDGLRDLHFRGELLAQVNNRYTAGREATRWYELALYRTADGRYVVVEETYNSLRQGEGSERGAVVCADARAVVEALSLGEDGLPDLDKELLQEAAKVDTRFAGSAAVNRENGKRIVMLIGNGHECNLSLDGELESHYRASKGHARILTGCDNDENYQRTKKAAEALERFTATLTQKQKKLYNAFNDLRNDNREAFQKELFIQGFFTGLTYAGELLLRGQVEKMKIEAVPEEGQLTDLTGAARFENKQ